MCIKKIVVYLYRTLKQRKNDKFKLDKEAEKKLSKAVASIPRVKGFANARAVRQLVENIKMNQATRLVRDKKLELNIIEAGDSCSLNQG